MPAASKPLGRYQRNELIALAMGGAVLRSLREYMAAPDYAKARLAQRHVRLCNATKLVARAIGMECG